MYIVVSYDISSDCASKVRRHCAQYLTPVQISVFEGEIAEKKLRSLKRMIAGLIDPGRDSVIIYNLEPYASIRKESIGRIAAAGSEYVE